MSPLVRRYLDDREAAYATVAHAPLISFDDAKAILPHDPAKMVKGLVFVAPGDELAIFAMPAAARADYKKIADALSMRRADLRMADPDVVLERLDMEVGGIVPLPINAARVMIDRGVLDLDEVICGSGRNTCTLVLSISEFARLSQGQIGEYAKPA